MKQMFFWFLLIVGMSYIYPQNLTQYQREIERLIYDFQTGNITNLEYENRASMLTADITSGNIRENARNDIEWRKQWITRITETEQYFDNYFKKNLLPCTLFYSTTLEQGAINYQLETMSLNLNINLHNFSSWLFPIENTLQTVYRALYDGLEATNKKNDWGLNNWPHQSITSFRLFERRSRNFIITAELVNSHNKIISKQEFQISNTWEPYIRHWEDWNNRYENIKLLVSDDDKKTINFTNIKIDDITDNLIIRITRVNGVDAQTASRNGVLQIKALSEDEWEANAIYNLNKGTITVLTGKGGDLTIPEKIWDDLVIAIGYGSTPEGYRPLNQNHYNGYFNVSNITIPNSVIVIRNSAFSAIHNKGPLTIVNIGDGVITIENGAFSNNKITSVIIGNNVKTIEEWAFYDNEITSITIGANVELHSNSFGNIGFVYTYNEGGKLAGKYTRAGTHYYSKLGIEWPDTEWTRQ